MFYVYDLDGLRFKGRLEDLEQWRSVVRKTTIQPLKEEKKSLPSPHTPSAPEVAAYQRNVSRGNMVEPLVHVYQIMSYPVSTILPDVPLLDAWRMLKDGTIRQCVVITDQKKVVGMLSDRDILQRVNVVDGEVEVGLGLTVREVIKQEIITTDSMSDIRRVAKVFAYFHIDALPVLEQEKLVGIVTRGDILRGFAENPKLNLWA